MGWIKKAVNEIKKKYKTSDPFEIASLKNIHIIPWNLHEEILGFYKYDKRNKYIFINNNLDNEMKKYICAHELGHAILHPRVNTPFLRKNTLFSLDKIEVEADIFAVEILIPDELLYENISNTTTIYDASAAYGVPSELIHLKKY
ncbi:ImmA/IrrE family metallo-endopeptidase [Cytobacillus dafuensis]|uniref:ImmA/IrrE family metallo-endopeptidase n=1 Tax=Cytobacillus dafuensis TaxID=1742359 RepID=A0A5B8ZC93_CYTDA|nr:ImmA/IrrE family metallo-endopeptidase [Cytobacillus dafuensis]QED49339.1 ImmA/IrrE family metallo-endopeptidase [Cytobacillus dafuensis]